MEIYLLSAMILFYIITAVALSDRLLRKIWLAAFLLAFIITFIALSFLHFSNQAVMMNAAELSWYYLLYLFATIMSVLGIINFWMFRRQIWSTLSADSEDDI